MKVLRFTIVFVLALVSYPVGILYGLVVMLFRWLVMLLTIDIANILLTLWLIGVKMSSVLNAVSAIWLKAWLLLPGSSYSFGEYYPVSAVLGLAYRHGQLTSVGLWLRDNLEILDPGHCERAAQRHGLI
jgi:hypothetical protein